MRIFSKGRSIWYPWFAWYPVRIPADTYREGEWVWLERLERRKDYQGGYRFPLLDKKTK